MAQTGKVTYIDEYEPETELVPHDPVIDSLSDISDITTRYALPKSDEDVALARDSCVPASTKQDTSYCFKKWKEWASHRNSLSNGTKLYSPSRSCFC